MLKRIWDGIFGYNAAGQRVTPVVANDSPITTLPKIGAQTKTTTR
jgi:hypothetical protein